MKTGSARRVARSHPVRAAALIVVTALLLSMAAPVVQPAWADNPPAATALTESTASQPAADAQSAPVTAAKPEVAKSEDEGKGLLGWLEQFAPILILLIAIAVVLGRLPRVELGHSEAFRRRRIMNWLPLGLTYAFLYMGRYNLTVAQQALDGVMTVSDFSAIFGAGTVTYGLSFVLNGPLTDRIGGKRAILIGAVGAALMNLAMGAVLHLGHTESLVGIYSVLYSANMYFQSFGAVAIVKVNAPWFHVRERGVFGAIFGILISLGIYFAFDWGYMIVGALPTWWVFYIPAMLLGFFVVLDVIFVRDTPGEAGHRDFDTADASSGDDGPRLSVGTVFKKMITNPVIMTIAAIEFCSGFLRQAIMQYYRMYAKAIGATEEFVYQNWGLLLCVAGILGGVIAGVISDRLFGSRRGPVSAVLYGFMLVGAVVAVGLLGSPLLGGLVVLMSMAVIGVHGMLSGTASMDFGGKKNVGVAVGIIDGFVYLGTGFMSLVYFLALPGKEELANPSSWKVWPLAMIPMALIGLVLARRIWHAMPKGKASAPPVAQRASVGVPKPGGGV